MKSEIQFGLEFKLNGAAESSAELQRLRAEIDGVNRLVTEMPSRLREASSALSATFNPQITVSVEEAWKRLGSVQNHALSGIRSLASGLSSLSPPLKAVVGVVGLASAAWAAFEASSNRAAQSTVRTRQYIADENRRMEAVLGEIEEMGQARYERELKNARGTVEKRQKIYEDAIQAYEKFEKDYLNKNLSRSEGEERRRLWQNSGQAGSDLDEAEAKLKQLEAGVKRAGTGKADAFLTDTRFMTQAAREAHEYAEVLKRFDAEVAELEQKGTEASKRKAVEIRAMKGAWIAEQNALKAAHASLNVVPPPRIELPQCDSVEFYSDYNKELMTLYLNYEKGAVSLEEYNKAVEALVSKQPAAIKIVEEHTEKQQEQEAAQRAYIDSLHAGTVALEEQVKNEQDYIECIGLTTEALYQLELKKHDLAILEAEEALQKAQASQVTEKNIQVIEEETQELERQLQARKALKELYIKRGDAENNNTEVQKTKSQWDSIWGGLENDITASLTRAFASGENAAKALGKTIRDAFKNNVIKMTVQAAVNPIMSGVRSLFTPDADGTLGIFNTLGSLSGLTNGAAKVGEVLSDLATKGTEAFSKLTGLTEIPTWGIGASGLAGAMWAYNATGSYTAGVGGAALGLAGAGALSGAMAGTGAAAGALGGLNLIPGWGWAAAAVIAVIGDMLKKDPDPRVLYMMQNELTPNSEDGLFHNIPYGGYWEDAHKGLENVTAKGAFGYIGLEKGSKEVDANKFKQHLESLAALDNAIAAGLKKSEVDAVKKHMDGWFSGYENKRDTNNALVSRLLAIAEGIGGEAGADIQKEYDRHKQKELTALLEKPQSGFDRLNRSMKEMFESQRDSLKTALSSQDSDLAARVAQLTDVKITTADLLKLTEKITEARKDASSGTSPDLKKITGEFFSEKIRASLGDLSEAQVAIFEKALSRYDLGRPELSQDDRLLMLDLESFVKGFEQDKKSAGMSLQDLADYMLRRVRVDDVQTLLGKVGGNEIGVEAAMDWMAKSKTKVKDANGKEVEIDGFTNLAQMFGKIWESLYSNPIEPVKQQLDAYKEAMEELEQKTIPHSVVAYRELIKTVDLSTAEGRKLYFSLGELAPQMAELQKAMLGLIGTSQADLNNMIHAGLTGKATEEATAEALQASIIGGIESALAGNTANSITELMLDGIINPAIEAMLLGAELSEILAEEHVKSVIDKIEAQADVFAKLMSDPALQEALNKLRSSMKDVAGKVSEGAAKAGQTSESEIEKLRQEAIELYRKQLSESQRLADQFKSIADTLESLYKSLRISAYSPLSPEEKYREAKTRFEDVSRRAQLGDVDALSELDDISRSFLDLSKEYYGATAQYAADFVSVEHALQSGAETARRHESLAQQQVRLADEQLKMLDAIKGNLGADIEKLLRDILGKMPDEKAAGPAKDQGQGAEQAGASKTGAPSFFAGGLHSGGLRLVGEQGPELEVTGPARYYSVNETRALLGHALNGNRNNPATEGLLRDIAAELRALVRQGGAVSEATTSRLDMLARQIDGLSSEVRRAAA